jgi:hypothetical protein
MPTSLQPAGGGSVESGRKVVITDECVKATAAPAAAPTARSSAGVQATQTECVNFC